jgi:hypothetical protein
MKYHEILSGRNHCDTCGRTDGRTDGGMDRQIGMSKLTVTFTPVLRKVPELGR